MRARDLFERAAAPTEAPPKPGVKPGAPPVERPSAPPAPGKHPNPFRRRHPGKEPGPMPKPKACVEAVAKTLITTKPKSFPTSKPKSFPATPPKRFNRDSAIKHGRAKPLPDDKTALKGAIKKGKNDTKAVLKKSHADRFPNAMKPRRIGGKVHASIYGESAKQLIRTLR